MLVDTVPTVPTRSALIPMERTQVLILRSRGSWSKRPAPGPPRPRELRSNRPGTGLPGPPSAQPPVERAQADPQHGRRPALVAARVRERGLDEPPLGRLERHAHADLERRFGRRLDAERIRQAREVERLPPARGRHHAPP